MAAVFDSPFLSNRLRQIEEQYEEPTTFGKCDCTSYSYFLLSIVLLTIGTSITILALGDSVDQQTYDQLGHMWLVGPIFICAGLMVAIKCMLYLRRKSVIQMIIHQRQLFRHLQELSGGGQGISTSGSGTPGPPPYEVIAQSQGPASELPPPTYAEAVALLQSGFQDAKPCGTVDNTSDSAPTKP